MSAPSSVYPLAHRCRVICDSVGLPRAVGEQFIKQVVATSNLREATASDDRADQTVVYLLSMAYLGRSPTPEEAAQISQLLATESPAAIDLNLKAWPACRKNPARNQLIPTDPGVTYVDVSHTLYFRRNSGIQRVVRQFAAALAASDHLHAFVWFDERLQGYRPLTTTERDRLLDWERFSSFVNKTMPSQHGNNRLKRWLKKAGGSQFGKQLRRFLRVARDCSRKIRRGLEQGLRSQPEPAFIYFVWQGRLLLPDVITAPAQLNCLITTMAAAPLPKTMILYDLLPVTHSEYFVRNGLAAFIQYLTLLRHVDQISCISKDVSEKLASLLATIPRTKPEPRIATHLLAGDFQPPPSVATSAATLPPHEQVVLCVGTIEPRKNQTRILRAMVAAQQSGRRFRGIFVGNAGWLNGQFRNELRKACSRGIQVELHEGISDEALASLYRTATLTVYCSVAEGFGLPIVESVMAGVPCLTSNLGSMREIAEQIGGCSLVNPYSTNAINAALTRLLGDDEELARLTSEARRASWHSWSDYCEQLMTFVAADDTAKQPFAVDQSRAAAS